MSSEVGCAPETFAQVRERRLRSQIADLENQLDIYVGAYLELQGRYASEIAERDQKIRELTDESASVTEVTDS